MFCSIRGRGATGRGVTGHIRRSAVVKNSKQQQQQTLLSVVVLELEESPCPTTVPLMIKVHTKIRCFLSSLDEGCELKEMRGFPHTVPRNPLSCLAISYGRKLGKGHVM